MKAEYRFNLAVAQSGRTATLRLRATMKQDSPTQGSSRIWVLDCYLDGSNIGHTRIISTSQNGPEAFRAANKQIRLWFYSRHGRLPPSDFNLPEKFTWR